MPGPRCGKYQLIDKIGEGGMAEIWRAWHADLSREAAIKLLQYDKLENEEVVRRFIKEARTASAIRDSGIVTIYDTGVAEDGRVYIAMELLQGESLGDRLRRVGRLSIEESTRFMKQLANVMQKAHQAGILHRDLKPDNLFLVPDSSLPGGEHITVLDFGLAKFRLDGANSQATSPNTVFGSPLYTAPEQWRGAGAVDERGDLYSIGCIFYHCVCGRPPFDIDNWYSAIEAHLLTEPPSPKTYCSELSDTLEELLLRLLEKDRETRVQSCMELLLWLEASEDESDLTHVSGDATIMDDEHRHSSGVVSEPLLMSETEVLAPAEFETNEAIPSALEANESTTPMLSPALLMTSGARPTELETVDENPRRDSQEKIPGYRTPAVRMAEAMAPRPRTRPADMYSPPSAPPSAPPSTPAQPGHRMVSNSSLTGSAAQIATRGAQRTRSAAAVSRWHRVAWVALTCVLSAGVSVSIFFWLYDKDRGRETVLQEELDELSAAPMASTPGSGANESGGRTAIEIAPTSARAAKVVAADERAPVETLDDSEIHALLEESKRAMADGDYETAWDKCHRVIIQGGEAHRQANLLCAISKCKLGDTDAALEYYRRLQNEKLRRGVRERCTRDGASLPEP